MKGNFLTGIIIIIITLSLGYWFFNLREKPDSVALKDPVIKDEAILEKNADDSVVDKDHVRSLETSHRSAKKAPSEVSDTEIPKLYGTIITRNNKIAIFDDPQTNSTATFSINDSLGGFIVSDIQRDKVLLLRGDEIIEVGLRDPKGVGSELPPSVAPSTTTETSNTKIPLRPIPPPRADNKPIPGMDDQLTSEEMVPPEGYAKGLAPTHERFDRRPVHEELTSPLTPPPPIPPTFD